MPDQENNPTHQSKKGASQIDQFARSLCSRLAEQGNEEFTSEEVIWGLANFLKVLADIAAKQQHAETLEQVDNSDRLS